MRRRAYGTSDADGTWRENASNAFTKLIDVARGQRDVVQAGAPALRDRAKEIDPREIDSAEILE